MVDAHQQAAKAQQQGRESVQQEPACGRRDLLLWGLGLLAMPSLAACARRRRPSTQASAVGPVADLAAGPGLWYVVESGDTLSSIGRKSGLTVDQISGANRLSTALIRPGDRLYLPGVRQLGRDPLAGLLDREPEHDAPLPELGDAPYRIIRRRQWTSAAIAANHRPMSRITRITLHHTGEYAGTARLSDREILRRIDRFHREGRNWAAIGYHYLIAADGRIYEGRPENIQGAHTRGNNSNNLGISMMGDFHRSPPGSLHLAVLNSFLNDTRLRLRVPKARIFGHRDLSPSICPGDALYAWLQRFKAS